MSKHPKGSADPQDEHQESATADLNTALFASPPPNAQVRPLSDQLPALRLVTQVAPTGLGGGGAMYCPVVSPNNQQDLYVAGDMGALFHSQDGGTTWTMLDGRQFD